MKKSSLQLLQQPTMIVLGAGHGGSSPGAVNAPYEERSQTISIVTQVAEILEQNGIDIKIIPHEYGLEKSITWVNDLFGFGDAWVLELHRDSAGGLDIDDASRRCGIYYGTSDGSKAIGKFVRDLMIAHGAHPKSWARPDTASRHGSLGWIRRTRPLAHLLELGFMQGKNDDAHLSWLAKVAASAIYEAFTGNTLESLS